MNINAIISSCLDQLEYGENEFQRVHRMAIRGIRIMKWDFIGTVLTTKINILPNRTAFLPIGFMSERKVGVENDAGEIATLTENPNLSLLDADRVGDERFANPSGYTSESVFDDLDGDNNLLSSPDEFIANRMGIGSNVNIGDYRIDRSRNIIVFGSNFPHKSFVLEYLSSLDCNGVCEVPEMVSEALIAFVVWKFTLGKKGVSVADKRDSERIYNNELRLAKRRISKITKSRMNQTSRNAVRQSVKG